VVAVASVAASVVAAMAAMDAMDVVDPHRTTHSWKDPRLDRPTWRCTFSSTLKGRTPQMIFSHMHRLLCKWRGSVGDGSG
jgi:hypothetical protein